MLVFLCIRSNVCFILLLKRGKEMKFDAIGKRRIYEQRRRIKLEKSRIMRKVYIKKRNRSLNRLAMINHPDSEVNFEAPKHFSIIENEAETVGYFNKIIEAVESDVGYSYKIKLDLTNINKVTIEAIMYLLAIANNIKKKNHQVTGNYPECDVTRNIFRESGFEKFVRSEYRDQYYVNEKMFKISTGSTIDTESGRKLIEFLDKNGVIKGSKISKDIYRMVIELMGNTNNHAYSIDSPFINKWYLYAEKRQDNKISLVFLDTGSGIPTTIRRKISDITRDDKDLIASAFDGENRTRTRQSNRGLGLPEIKSINRSGSIQNLKIISCNGRVDMMTKSEDYDKINISKKMIGTLFYWEISQEVLV